MHCVWFDCSSITCLGNNYSVLIWVKFQRLCVSVAAANDMCPPPFNFVVGVGSTMDWCRWAPPANRSDFWSLTCHRKWLGSKRGGQDIPTCSHAIIFRLRSYTCHYRKGQASADSADISLFFSPFFYLFWCLKTISTHKGCGWDSHIICK